MQLGATGGVEEAIDAVLRGTRAADLESVTLDFKRAKASFEDTARDLAEAVACFANARGGAVVVGVDDKRSGQDAFVGCGFEAEALRRRIWELTNPSVTVTARIVRAGESDLVVLVVPEGLEVHSVGGRASHRVGKSCEPMSASEQARLIEERRGSTGRRNRRGGQPRTSPPSRWQRPGRCCGPIRTHSGRPTAA